MSENQTNPAGSAFPTSGCCAQAEALVIIEAVPLCCIDPLGAAGFGAAALAACSAFASAPDGLGAGLPVRVATVMPCAQALSLAEEVGHVVF